MTGWVLAAALLLADPSGDAHGAGDLAPPTAAVYESLGAFDLTEVEVLDGEPLRVRVGLASMDNPGDLPLGVTLPIVEVYLDTDAESGEGSLLPGSGMQMPEGHGWNVALRVTGDEAFAMRVEGGERVQHPLRVQKEDDALVLVTPFPAPERARPYAVTGVYDPFDGDGWRPHAEQPSPWAFSSPVPAPPVVDVLAPDGAVQREAIRSATLPPPSRGVPGAPWLVLMVVGVVVAVVGVVLRFVAPDSAAAEAPVAAAPASDGEAVPPPAGPAGDEGGDARDTDDDAVAPEAAAPRPLDVTWSEAHGWVLREEDGFDEASADAWRWPDTPSQADDDASPTAGVAEGDPDDERA